MSQMLDNEAYAAFWRAHPLHVVEISKNMFNASGGGGTTGILSAIIYVFF
jgi:hypothetical protein